MYSKEKYLDHQIVMENNPFHFFMFIYKNIKIDALGIFAKYILLKSNKIIVLQLNDCKWYKYYCKHITNCLFKTSIL